MKIVNLKFVTTAIVGLAFASSSYGQVGFNATNNSGTDATALGFETIASGSRSSAFGFRSKATGLQSFSAGHWSTASGTYSFALGSRAMGTGTHSMAFGLDVRANGLLSMIIGNGTGNGTANAMQNNIDNSLMVGFNSTIPTFFVGSSSGAGTIGNVGIGTSSPGANLDVRGVASNPNIRLTNSSGNYLEFGVADCNGCYSTSSTPGDAVARVLGGGDLIFAIPGTNSSRQIAFDTGGGRVMTVQEVGSTGKVGVGTQNFPTTIGGANISAYKMFVAGGILTDELRVRAGWADYVFQEDYKLKPLSEVAEYIENNGHLPNVPSAAQVEEEGIELGEITKVQQEKIEELTLYLIELKQQVEELKTQVAGMEEQ